MLKLQAVSYLAHFIGQQLLHGSQQAPPLTGRGMHGLIQQPVAAKFSMAAWQASGVQDGQLGLALVVLSTIAILQGSSSMGLVHLQGRQTDR
jgi:hypothetical protein